MLTRLPATVTPAQRPRALRTPAALLLCAGALLTGGCWTPGQTDREREIQLLREQVQRQQDELAARQASINELTRRLEQARGIKDEDLKKLFYPEKLIIDGLSGGYDVDGQPGDDGVVVYLKPVDAEGDTLKVAGDIRIQLYDLAAPPAQNFLGEYFIPVEQARELWHGKLMTNHYTIRCPWLRGPPKNPEITIRATFVDYLTQRVISAQRTCMVNLPPKRSAPTAP